MILNVRNDSKARGLNAKFSRPLRTVVAAFAVLVSGCGISFEDHSVDSYSAHLMATSKDSKERGKGLDILASEAKKDGYYALQYKYNLTDVARRSEYADSRLGAVARINDPEQLNSIAVLSDYEDSATAAFEKLGKLVRQGKADGWLLANAVNSRHINIRLRAIVELDENGLFQAYRGTDDQLVSRIILEKFASMVKDLKNPDVILTVAIHATNGSDRLTARRMLADDKARSEIIRQHDS